MSKKNSFSVQLKRYLQNSDTENMLYSSKPVLQHSAEIVIWHMMHVKTKGKYSFLNSVQTAFNGLK